MSQQPPRYQTIRADPQALAALQDAYEHYTQAGVGHRGNPWTCTQATRLGQLYVRAWRELPRPNRMRGEWCLPNAQTLLRLFGSYQRYWDTLALERAEALGQERLW